MFDPDSPSKCNKESFTPLVRKAMQNICSPPSGRCSCCSNREHTRQNDKRFSKIPEHKHLNYCFRLFFLNWFSTQMLLLITMWINLSLKPSFRMMKKSRDGRLKIRFQALFLANFSIWRSMSMPILQLTSRMLYLSNFCHEFRISDAGDSITNNIKT